MVLIGFSGGADREDSIFGREMKCQDPEWTERGEGDLLGWICRSRTKVGGSKVIRYRSSSNSKRCRHCMLNDVQGRNLRIRALGIVCSQE